jgi:hypothetical protein
MPASWSPPFQGRSSDYEGARKNPLLKISCNPLISLDPDERIQGNPSFSNPKTLGFRSETGRSKKTQTGSTNDVANTVEKEPNRLPLGCTAVKADRPVRVTLTRTSTQSEPIRVTGH